MSGKRSRAGIPSDLDKRRRGVLRRFQQGVSIRDCARLAGCAYETARRWIREAERIGFEEALRPRNGPKGWSKDLKREVALAFLAGASPAELVVRYGLPNADFPRLWAKAMKQEDLPAPKDLAVGAFERAVAAHGRGDEQWRVWISKMRSHFEQAVATAPDDKARIVLMRMQADLMEKCFALSSSEKSLKDLLVQIVTELKAQYPVGRLLAAVGLARSSYYWHIQRSEVPDRDADLKQRLVAAHERSRGAYGYRRLVMALATGSDKQSPLVVNHKKVRRLMTELGLKGKTPSRRRYRSFKGPDPEAVNLLNRRFRPDGPGQALVTDITMFTLGATRLYLSPLIDLFNSQVLAWRISTNPESAMACGMLAQGLKALPPDAKPIVHTDQGTQYTSHQWKKTLKEYGAIQSMSRVGNCHDNAPAESFFARLKTELGRGETANTPNQFINQIRDYLQWWNEERIVSRLGTSPVKYSMALSA